jgi:prepilin-type N-terminal cleavage/methylation domain-containing protein
MRKNRRKERSLLQLDTNMSKGFTLIEMVLTVIILSILSAFTFSVIWQYSRLYADTKGGYIYGEASAILDRMSRELGDAGNVDRTGFTGSPLTSTTYISFQPGNGTPADQARGLAPLSSFYGSDPTGAYWVQYCVCTPANGTRSLYRVASVSAFGSNLCATCPPAQGALMSSSIRQQGFAVQYNQAGITSDNDSYTITLGLTSNRAVPDNPSITLVTRATPRNYAPYDSGGMGSDRSFNGGYYDEIN